MQAEPSNLHNAVGISPMVDGGLSGADGCEDLGFGWGGGDNGYKRGLVPTSCETRMTKCPRKLERKKERMNWNGRKKKLLT